MAKYSDELKMRVVEDYLLGNESYKSLAQKYGVKNKTQVENWIKSYRDFGVSGFCRKNSKQTFPSQVKLDAVELMLKGDLSQREIAKQFGISNVSMLSNWLSKYRNEGVDGLTRTIGRPSNMANNLNKPPVTSDEKDARIKELEKQLYFSQMENDYLKELRKLVLKKQKSKPKN